MTEFRNAAEQLKAVLLRIRPTVRPFVIIPLWLLLIASAIWDLHRVRSGNPPDVLTTVSFYAITLGTALFDLAMERRLRRGTDSV
jgi:hypothetical protein